MLNVKYPYVLCGKMIARLLKGVNDFNEIMLCYVIYRFFRFFFFETSLDTI